MPIHVDRRRATDETGVYVVTRNGKAMHATFQQAGLSHKLISLDEIIHGTNLLLPQTPLVIDSSEWSVLETAHVLRRLSRVSTTVPIIAVAHPRAFAHLRLLPSCPSICAIIAFPVDTQVLHSVLEYARTLAMDDVQDGPIWFEVLPLQTERCLDIVEVIVALDGAASLSMVQARLNVSRATLRRRLVLVAASLGMSGMYSQPTEWLRAILAALQVSPLIG